MSKISFPLGANPDLAKIPIAQRAQLTWTPPREAGTKFEYPDGTKYVVMKNGEQRRFIVKPSKKERRRQREIRRMNGWEEE